MSTAEKIARINGSFTKPEEPRQELCVFCDKHPWYDKYPPIQLLYQVVRKAIQTGYKIEIRVVDDPDLCYHNQNSEAGKWLVTSSLENFSFIENAILFQTSLDYNTMWHGVADVDVRNPLELIDLFSDMDVLEFVLLRNHDLRVSEEIEIKNIGKNFENSKKMFSSLDKEWLESLKQNYSYNLKRHIDFNPDNITKNPEHVKERRLDFDAWVTRAQKTLGRKLEFKSYGNEPILI